MSENSLEERYCQGTEVTASLGQEVLQQQILVAEFGVTQDPGVTFPKCFFLVVFRSWNISHLSIRIHTKTIEPFGSNGLPFSPIVFHAPTYSGFSPIEISGTGAALLSPA